ncbi:MAG TPA: FAD-dependent oxidoreductase [Polyangiaceae bacterium]|nr:FAD-dependent oxidoreductase [Polyangiaceae bacterium]
MSNSADYVDVVVVGAGLSGLGAAAYLARAGLSVRLVERASAAGGRAATARVRGFCFNRGPHALYRAGEAYRVLRELGVPFSGQEPPVHGQALRGGELYDLPVDSRSLFSTRLFGWKRKWELGKLLGGFPRIAADELATISFSHWLDERVSEESRAVVEAFGRLSSYVTRPDLFSAATAVRQLQRALQSSVLYLDGGWQTLADGLAAVARTAGAHVECGVRVEALATDPRAGYRVELGDGRSLRAAAVVLATPPQEAARLISSSGACPAAALVDAIPVRMATLDVALAKLPRAEPRFVLGIDRPYYFSVHSGVAKLAPHAGALIHASKYLRGDETDPAKGRAELEALLDLAQPGWRAELMHAQYLPRITVAERLDLAGEGGAAARPPAAVPELPGLFLAGDWVPGGNWLADASLGSARSTSQAVARHLQLQRAVA